VTTDTRSHDIAEDLADFTATPRLVMIGGFAIGIGIVSAFVAWVLLALIGIFTNLFFFQRFSTALVTPEGHTLGPWVILVPVAGALVIGVMARYGSERIRGHGIPEAIEAILINGSRIDPKVALLKPLSSAISIGSGGPFGAEGPIIMTGGAVGSLIAQFFHLTSAERKTLLVAGAAAGMSATFAAPLAAVLLAVELLLFEWKPRSVIPVALASATAAAARRSIIGLGPLFPVPPHAVFIGPQGLLGCVLAGVLAGALSAVLTQAVYAAEDAFQHLRMHWMWWPAIGGLVIGVGGWMFPQALGVGYDVIGALLRGDVGGRVILGILIVKSVIWSVSLGSGTSGGVLAPLLMMGGALGGVEAWFLPAEGLGFWPAGQHGRDSRRHDAIAADRSGLRARAHARHQHGVAPAGRSDHRTRVHRAHAAAVHSDRKDCKARVSLEPGIRGRPTGDSVRPGSDANQCCRSAGRRHVRHAAPIAARRVLARPSTPVSGDRRRARAGRRGHPW
jgi:H+/Cl- antiporter ClcA